MKVAIIGSRTFDDYKKVEDVMKEFNVTTMVSGGAKGADSLGEKWAIDNGVETMIFKADWKKYGRSAGPIRNKDIIANSDIVIAFWDGKSKGTKHSISLAEKQGKKVKIIYI